MTSTKTNPGRTNQKLYFARLQQELLEKALASSGFAAEPTALACREAVIFHLHGAYLSFLHELCRFYKLPVDLGSSEALRQAMAAKGQVSPEVAQLQGWEAESGHWLAELLAAHARCLSALEPVKVEPEDEEEGARLENPAVTPNLMKEITIIQTDTDLPLSEPDRARLTRWHQGLTEAIREFRREMMEW